MTEYFAGGTVDKIHLPMEGTWVWSLVQGGFYLPQSYYWRRQWHPTPVLLLGKSRGWRSLVGYSPCDGEELEMAEQLHFHFSLWCIGEGNGNPLQCSCLENPRDGGAWWAAIYGVSQSWTRLKRPSGSSIRAPKYMSHNSRSLQALGPVRHSLWAQVLQLLKPLCLEPALYNRRSPCTTTRG